MNPASGHFNEKYRMQLDFRLNFLIPFYFHFLPLGATARGELWPPEKSASILLSIRG
jgi:hypothetical protein